MRNVVEVFTYGVITDWFYIKKRKKEANSMYKALLAKHLGSRSSRVVMRKKWLKELSVRIAVTTLVTVHA